MATAGDAYLLSRAALIVTPQAPYIAWAESVLEYEGGSERSAEERGAGVPSIYLVQSALDFLEEESVLREHYATIFEQELRGWGADEDEWPEERDFETFLAWFDVQVVTNVLDIAPYELDLSLLDS
jgi:hypothetical protein